MEFHAQITDLDFIVPEVWEGPGEGLHLNDLVAADSPYGKRVLSGITSVILGTLPLSIDTNWLWPKSLEWSFDDAVCKDDIIHGTWVEAQETPGLWRTQLKRKDGSTLSRGSIEYGTHSTPDVRAEPEMQKFSATPGRTLFSADSQLFDWWIGQHQTGVASTFGMPIVPWPLFVSLASGLMARSWTTDAALASVVNRAMRWNFSRPLQPNETLVGRIENASERISRTRPDVWVWEGHCVFESAGDSGRLIGTCDWVLAGLLLEVSKLTV